jgi:hypothetical protein
MCHHRTYRISRLLLELTLFFGVSWGGPGGENLGFRPMVGRPSLCEVSHTPPNARYDNIMLRAGTCTLGAIS